MSVLDSKIFNQKIVEMHNLVRPVGDSSRARPKDTPARVAKMTLKNLANLRANKATFS